MNKKEAKQRVEKLKALINKHRYLYHVLDRQEISDAALDSLKKELFDLEQRFPELVTPDSPTQRVGGEAQKEFKKVAHPQRMLSFNDAFGFQDMQDWRDRVLRLLDEKEKLRLDFYCELKIDGLAIELTYLEGLLEIGSTRGDGFLGEDITQNVKTVEAIPLNLRSGEEAAGELANEGLNDIGRRVRQNAARQLTARGEVFISKKEFAAVNKAQQEKGLPRYANPRNIAAGSVRQLDPKVTASRKLDSFAYELLEDFGQTTHEQKHQILHALGFKTNTHNRFCKTLEEVFAFYDEAAKLRERLPYEIDGVVVIVNDIALFEKLGVAGKAPRGAIAFKFPQSQATTRVKDITVQVGRTGAMTPVAVLDPVQVQGITITRATLHNEDEIKRLGLKIGDTVIVGRAGDVIPDIIKVLPELRNGSEHAFAMPKTCPACGTRLEKPENEALWRCPNPQCFARSRRQFYHFVSRPAFNIEGLGPETIDRLLDEGLVQDPADLFMLKEGDVAQLERFAEKSAGNLINSIQEKKFITLPRFIYALGIRNVGSETAVDLSERFGSLEKIRQASREEFESVPDVGPVVAESLHQWFNNKKNQAFLDKLKAAGVKVKNQKPKTKNQKWVGSTFVFTGTMDSIDREAAKEKVRQLGGEVSESVSKKTAFVVAGREPGSKLDKAKKLRVKVLNEEEFLRMT